MSRFGFGSKLEKTAPNTSSDPFRQRPMYAVIRITEKTAMGHVLSGSVYWIDKYEAIQGLFREQKTAEEFRDDCRSKSQPATGTNDLWVIRVLATDIFG